MDLSITDLIVKTDRPGGPRGNDRAAALATATSTSISTSAFNDLLARIDARVQAPTAERPDADHRAARDDRDPRTGPADRHDRASRDERTADDTESTRDSGERQAPDSREHDGATVADTDIVAAPQSSMRPDDAGVTPAPKNAAPAVPGKTAADGLTLPASAAKNPVFTADETATTAAPAASRTKTADGATTVTPDGKAAPDQAAANATKHVRPAPLADFSVPAQKSAGTVQDDNLAALAKSALAGGKNGTGDAGKGAETKAAETAAQALQESKPERPDQARGPRTEAGALRATISGQNAAPEPAPLRGPAVNGVIAAQEVSAQGAGNGQGAAQANTGNGQNNAQNTAAQQATPQAGTPPGAPRADAMNAAAGAMTPPVMNGAEPPRTGFAAAGTAGQPPGMPGAVTGALPGTMPGVGQAGTQAALGTTQPQAAARAQASVPVPVEDVAVHIARAAANGNDQISIRLKPASLGHVEVRMDVKHDGKVSAVITADRADTLDMLARDAKGLERALADAGLKTDSGDLQFNLRGEGQSGNAFGSRDDGAAPGHARHVAPAGMDGTGDSPLPHSGAYTNLRAASGGLDIRV